MKEVENLKFKNFGLKHLSSMKHDCFGHPHLGEREINENPRTMQGEESNKKPSDPIYLSTKIPEKKIA